MKGFRVFAAAMCAAMFSVAAVSQQASAPSFYQTNCVKVKPEKDSDFRKWARETLHKYAQARVDGGSLSSWFLMRAVAPQGANVPCDYVVVGAFPGLPPKPLSPDELTDVLKKAGIGMTAEQYAQSRNALSELAENGIFTVQARVGGMEKGDYVVVNLDKTADAGKWLEAEKKLWQGMAEQFVKQGMIRGWYANARLIPDGSAMRYNVLTADVYPSWDAYFQFQTSPKFLDIWKQVHPDVDPNAAFADYAKTVDRVSVELWVIDDLVTAAK